jgi:ComF family protein
MLHHLIDLLFPKTCVCCDEVLNDQEPHICDSCLLELPIIELSDKMPFSKLAGRIKPANTHAYLKFNKRGKAQKILHEIKYKGNQELGIFIGNQFFSYLSENAIPLEVDFLVPVPLHTNRLKSRGYNQAEVIANGISQKSGIELKTNILLKAKEASSQTNKGRAARLENMQDCFTIAPSIDLKGKNVGIVDDVMTTGATIEACCLCLESAGVNKITILSLAVA